MNRFLMLLFLPAFALGQIGQAKEIPFSFKLFLNLVNYFDNKKELIEFFDFKKGDTVADIGAGAGKYEGAFSLLSDSVTYFVQDIDKDILSQDKLNKVVKHYSSLKGIAQTNKFQLCIGTEKSTNLPDSAFDKIIMLSSFHEFTFMDEMIADISKKLKPGGKVYIIDAFCSEKGHVNYTSHEVILRMKKHGFTLIKLQGTNKNNSEGLYKAIFQKTN
jgi:ubiquinone/menaquinone biosynthesis C-methylase UbiE